MSEALPQHLKKYIATQDYEKYTPVDQAVWRFILRQLKSYLVKHAHSSYLDGLEKTGIEIERIPNISDISAKLEKFGWRALPVSGFIPPAAFMELQSLSVLPIASDLRTLEHLLYTPAPDIVHEAAGHAPMLVNPEFAQYLKDYAQVARKAIISKEDLDLYEAIRVLSDLKENPTSTSAQIAAAQTQLEQVSKSMTHVSEAGELSRMNWWTAEYGLIGDLDKPKIFGAGLLSSVGESKWCLSSEVKKIPLSINCLKQTYDITEPQPQLFVARDFAHLSKVLIEMAELMAFRTGGLSGLNKALIAKSLNTVQWSSGAQVSGELSEIILNPKSANEAAYLKFKGPCQISFQEKELPGHNTQYHQHGFGSPVGLLENSNKCLSILTIDELKTFGIIENQTVHLKFSSGVTVRGILKSKTQIQNQNLILSFIDCEVKLHDQLLFAPDWGVYDMVLGEKIPSVFGGPADRLAYGETEDFVALKVPKRIFSEKEKSLHALYLKLRAERESKKPNIELDLAQELFKEHQQLAPHDWLFLIELIEILSPITKAESLKKTILSRLAEIQENNPKDREIIQDGLALAAVTAL